MQKTSTFTIGKNEVLVKTDIPENLCEQIGHTRASQLLGSFGIAHWVQSGVKKAFALEKDPGKASQKVLDEAKSVRDAVNAGKSLDIMDFVPNARGEGKSILEFRAKWPQASEDKRLAFLKSKGMDEALASEDVETVLPFYVEWLESKDDMGL